jgi:hypothetical protein
MDRLRGVPLTDLDAVRSITAGGTWRQGGPPSAALPSSGRLPLAPAWLLLTPSCTGTSPPPCGPSGA